MRDRGDMHDRVHVRERVVAGVVAERTFHPLFRQVDGAFNDDLRVLGNFEIDRFGLHQMDRLLAQEPRKKHLVDAGRQGRGRRIGERRIAAQRDRRPRCSAASPR